jgi:trimethylamine:corrinoid methyltransferase-like protein
MTMAERSALKVDAILENHKPEPLPKDIKKALRDYVFRAQDAASNI